MTEPTTLPLAAEATLPEATQEAATPRPGDPGYYTWLARQTALERRYSN